MTFELFNSFSLKGVDLENDLLFDFYGVEKVKK